MKPNEKNPKQQKTGNEEETGKQQQPSKEQKPGKEELSNKQQSGRQQQQSEKTGEGFQRRQDRNPVTGETNAFEMRKEYHTKGEEKYTKDFLNEKGWSASKTEYKNLKELDQAVSQIHQITIADHASMAGDAIYLNPIITNQMRQNPFKEEKRVYPVDYGAPTEEVYMCKIVIPDGFQIDELPKSKVLALPQNGGRYTYNITQTGNVINLTSIFQVNRSIFTQAEYPNLREFYNQVVAKQAEQIVLKKN